MRLGNWLFVGVLCLSMALAMTATAQWQRGISLATADASFVGEQYNDYAGWAVAGAGDVNGDGLSDFLIGAMNYGEGGKVYLMMGKPSGWERGVSLAYADASFFPLSGQRIGLAISSAGDVNQDGFDDFLIGTRTSVSGFGQAYLFLGKESGWVRDTSLSEADASFMGEYDGDLAGGSVAGAGDVNRDGYDDFLIGAPGPELGNGLAYLILGREDGWVKDIPLTTADASFMGGTLSRAGGSLAGVGDTNGDGYDDFIIGAPGVWNDPTLGKVYLVLGRSDSWGTDVLLLETGADASFFGENEDDHAGGAVSGAGDVNGDGYDDFLIGASGNGMPDSTNAGRTYLILGRETGWMINMSLSAADASFWGEQEGDWSGYSLAGVEDINGDGYEEFLIGSRRNDTGGNDAGQVYLVRGRGTGWEIGTSLTTINTSYLGERAGYMAGSSVAGVGDVNGDDTGDFLVGATQQSNFDIGGVVYLIFGRPRMHLFLPIVVNNR